MIAETQTEVMPATDPVADLLADLRASFPVFAAFKPLRIGIHYEVRAALPERSGKSIRAAISRHVRGKRYLLAIARGGARYALDGTENGVVPESHRDRAKATLERMRKPIRQATPPATPPPPIAEPPAMPPPIARPILRLKKPASAIVAVAIARREVVS